MIYIHRKNQPITPENPALGVHMYVKIVPAYYKIVSW